MQIYKDLYPARTNSADPGYPTGKAVDAISEGTGTPVAAAWVNDVWGFMQAALNANQGLAANATPEKVGSSQVLQSIMQVAADNAVVSFADEAAMIAGTAIGGTTVTHRLGRSYMISSASGVSFYKVVSGSGDVTLGGGLFASQLQNGSGPRVRKLSAYGVRDGETATTEIAALFADAQEGDTVVIDVACDYLGAAGITKTVNRLDVVFTNGSVINAPNLDYTQNPWLLKFAGTQIATLTITSGDIEAGDTTVELNDVSQIQRGDLLKVETTEYFNGVAGASGFGPIDKEDLVRVLEVVGSVVHLENGFALSMLEANFSNVILYRPCFGITITDPQITGPGLQATLGNGTGSSGILFDYVFDCHVVGGLAIGWQNRAIGFRDSYYTSASNLRIDSGRTTRTLNNFYGVLHEGGRFCLVFNAFGNNIRRVADTSAAGVSVYVHHQQIIGETCNGAVAGTHHAYKYTFRDIYCKGYTGTGLSCRAIDTVGHGLYLYGDVGIGIHFGSDGNPDDNASAGVVKITGIDMEASASRGIRIVTNGDYSFDGSLRRCQNNAYHIQCSSLHGLKIRGEIVRTASIGIWFDIANCKKMDRVDIQGVYFQKTGSAIRDIEIQGTDDPTSPASNITISNNRSDSDQPDGIPNVVFTGGFFMGETVVCENNRASIASLSTPIIDVGGLYKFTSAPLVRNNLRFLGSLLYQFTRRAANYEIAHVSDIADMTAGGYDGITALTGDIVTIDSPAAGTYPRYSCTYAGTIGTLSGVTGDMTAGSADLTLTGNDFSKVFPGCIITIPGAGTAGADKTARVVSMSSDGLSATVNSAAGTTVSGAVLAYRPPTFKGSGLLEA